MPSSFFELSVASTGLFTTKGALNVVSHNIANAETKGYSRQVALTRARIPLGYGTGRGMVGAGSEMYGVGQIRNFYLDSKYWGNSGILGEYTAKSAQNRLTQAILNETDETGFNASLNNFFNIINRDWSIDAGNATARLAVINSAETLTQYFNTTYASLQKQQSDINLEVREMVSQVNNLGVQLQNLNKQIYTTELTGQNANDLRDARALVIDELSRYVNIDAKEIEVNKNLLTGESEKRFQVTINGADFVNHFNLSTLTCVERTVKNNFEDVNGLYDIYWPSGVKLNSENGMKNLGGELFGLLATRDGNNLNNPTVEIASVTPNGATGGVSITFSDWSREDFPESGNITINGKIYAYDKYNFTYDGTTGAMKLDIPPANGKMTVGDKIVLYSGLQISAGGEVTFKTVPALSAIELRSKIKIGDMVLDGSAAPVDSNGNVKITGSTTAQNIQNLTSLSGSVPPVAAKVGSQINYKGLPYFMAKLNTFARGLARSFNLGEDVHGNDLGISGHWNSYNRIEGDNTGYNFFTYEGIPNEREQYFNYHDLTAGNFTVSANLKNNSNALAAALSSAADPSDGSAILELLSLKRNPGIYDEGEYGNFVESLIGELGIVTNEAISFEGNYTDITAATDYQRLSVSSVNLDEEMALMVYLQQIYNACANLITTLNGIYSTTINMV